jgi:hypothetical protein
MTFLSLYQSVPYEAYKDPFFAYKDPNFRTQIHLFVPTSSPPFSTSHLIIIPSSLLFSPSFF